MDHVRRLCARGDYLWAHSYVTRLIADHPEEPEPLLLRAMIHARRGDPEAARRDLAGALALAGDASAEESASLRAEVETLLDSPREERSGRDHRDGRARDGSGEERRGGFRRAAGRGFTGLLGAAVGILLIRLISEADARVADALGFPVLPSGDSLPGTLIVAGAACLLWLLGWVVWAELKGDGVRAELRRRRALARATAEGFDDDNLRLNAASLASFLCLAPMVFLLPTSFEVGFPLLLPRAWTILSVALLAWWVHRRFGGEQLRRAFRLSRLVVLHTVVAAGWAVAVVAVPLRMSSLDGAAGPYVVCWSLGGWLLFAPFLIIAKRRLSDAGRLQIPSHWRERGARPGQREA